MSAELFPVVVSRAQRRLARLYRSRAREALSWARYARDLGCETAMRGYADEALLWRNFANDWARRARVGVL